MKSRRVLKTNVATRKMLPSKVELEKWRANVLREMTKKNNELYQEGVSIEVVEPSVMRVIGYLLEGRVSSKNFESEDNHHDIFKQTNVKQRLKGAKLVKLFQDLNVRSNPAGSAMIHDIKKNKNIPFRYIFIFKKGKEVVGFYSATKSKETKTATIDYVCPNVARNASSRTFVQYALLKMLWLNDNGGAKRYHKVGFKGRWFSDVPDVLKMS